MTVQQLIAEYRAKHPKKIWGRTKRSIAFASNSLERDERPIYAFISKYWRGANRVNAVVVFTNKRLIIAQEPIFGDYLESINIEHISNVFSRRKMFKSRFTIRTLASGGGMSSSYSFIVAPGAAEDIQREVFKVQERVKRARFKINAPNDKPQIVISPEIKNEVASAPEVIAESIGTERDAKLELIKSKLEDLKRK